MPELARAWDAEHVSPPLPPLLDHAEVVRRLTALTAAARDLFAVEKIGESLEGRSISDVRIGSGSTVVLLWSQMHGDEPTATAALFDLFEYLRRHRDEPMVRRILAQLTLHVVPMLNPDGAERFQRRNAQSIDINRDALRLQTPEGRVLKDAARPAEPEGRLQPAQPELAHVGRHAAETGLDLAAVGGLRRIAERERRPQADQEDVRGDSRRARAVWRPGRSAATTTSSRSARSATTSRCGARPSCSSRPDRGRRRSRTPRSCA